MTQVAIDLGLPSGSGLGDGQTDTIVINATNGADVITVTTNNGVVTVTGLVSVVTVSGFEATDRMLPVLPTIAEFVPGYEFSFWTGIGAPRNTPAEIVDKLNTEINEALVDPKMKTRLAQWGASALPGSPVHFGTLIAKETKKWGKVVRFAGIKAD